MNATATITRNGRFCPTYTVSVADSTAAIAFSGLGRAEAEGLAPQLTALTQGRTVARVAAVMAETYPTLGVTLY